MEEEKDETRKHSRHKTTVSLRSQHRFCKGKKNWSPHTPSSHHIKVPRGPIHESDPRGRSDEMLQDMSDDMT